MKKCCECKLHKDPSEFSKHKSRSSGLSDSCKVCHNIRAKALYIKNRPKMIAQAKAWAKDNQEYIIASRLTKYWPNMTAMQAREEYLKLFAKQNGKCAICNKSGDESVKGLGVDHCHSTGAVRGLLCGRCNTGIGQMLENVDILSKAISYLKSSITNSP